MGGGGVNWMFTQLGALVRHLQGCRADVVPMPGGMFRANVWTRKGQSSATFYRPEHAQEWADFTMEDEQ